MVGGGSIVGYAPYCTYFHTVVRHWKRRRKRYVILKNDHGLVTDPVERCGRACGVLGMEEFDQTLIILSPHCQCMNESVQACHSLLGPCVCGRTYIPSSSLMPQCFPLLVSHICFFLLSAAFLLSSSTTFSLCSRSILLPRSLLFNCPFICHPLLPPLLSPCPTSLP